MVQHLELPPGSWQSTARNISLHGDVLTCELQTMNGDWKRQQLVPIPGLEYSNSNGIFAPTLADYLQALPLDELRELLSGDALPIWLRVHWPPDPETDSLIMSRLFPLYTGDTKSIRVTKAFMLSVDKPDNRERVQQSLRNLSCYKTPPIEVVHGYTQSTMPMDMMQKYFKRDGPIPHVRLCELTLTAMKVWEQIAAGDDAWAFVFEDDVRVGNVNPGFDLTTWNNVPVSAEMLTFNRHGVSNVFEPSTAEYAVSFAGVTTHAVLFSRQAAAKLLAYAQKWGWRKEVDIDLYVLARGYSSRLRTGYNSWNPRREFDPVKLEPTEQIPYFDLATSSIFAQVTTPCPPIDEMAIPPAESDAVTVPWTCTRL